MIIIRTNKNTRIAKTRNQYYMEGHDHHVFDRL